MTRISTLLSMTMLLALGSAACDVDPRGGAGPQVLVDEERPDGFVVQDDGEVRRGAVARLVSGVALVSVDADDGEAVLVLSSPTEGDYLVDAGTLVSIDDADLDPLTARIVDMASAGELDPRREVPDDLVAAGISGDEGSFKACLIEAFEEWAECAAQARTEPDAAVQIYEAVQCQQQRDDDVVDCHRE